MAGKQDKNKDPYDWIEFAASAGRLVGLNTVRTRWKLRAWRDRMRAKKISVAGKAAAITREHKICPRCRALNSIESKVCIKCGTRLHSRPVEMIDRFLRNFSLGLTAETLLALGFVLAYAAVAVKGGSWFAFSAKVLIRAGGLQIPLTLGGQWWRPWTAVFLHGGLIHIFFNTYALIHLMPMARRVYGTGKVMFVFMVTGLGANLVSMGWALQHGGAGAGRVSIGASGALCGLIGMMLVWGHRDGTGSGLEIRNLMARWIIYTGLFGLWANVDNAAHVGGWIWGGLLAMLIPTSPTVREGRIWGVLGGLAGAASAAAVFWIMYLLYFTGPGQSPPF